MPNNDPPSFVIPIVPASEASELGPADPLDPDYMRSRERAERAAAKSASCIAGRRVHQQLAEAYAAMLHDSTRPAR